MHIEFSISVTTGIVAAGTVTAGIVAVGIAGIMLKKTSNCCFVSNPGVSYFWLLSFSLVEFVSFSLFIFIAIFTTFQPVRPSTFFKCFLSNSGAYTELQTEPFISSTGLDCSNSGKHHWGQVLSHRKLSFFILPVVRIETATSKWLYFIRYAMCPAVEFEN